MVLENSVKIAGLLHLIRGHMEDENQLGQYVNFSLRQDTPCENGRIRHDFLRIRAYDPEVKKWIMCQEEGTPIRVEGEAKSSLGSGEMYILAVNVEKA